MLWKGSRFSLPLLDRTRNLRTVGTKARGVEGSRGRGGRAATQRFELIQRLVKPRLSQPNTKKNIDYHMVFSRHLVCFLTRTREESNSIF